METVDADGTPAQLCCNLSGLTENSWYQLGHRRFWRSRCAAPKSRSSWQCSSLLLLLALQVALEALQLMGMLGVLGRLVQALPRHTFG